MSGVNLTATSHFQMSPFKMSPLMQVATCRGVCKEFAAPNVLSSFPASSGNFTTNRPARPSLLRLACFHARSVCKLAKSEGRKWAVVVGSAFGAPQIFAPNRSETLQKNGFGASGLNIGAPQKRRFNDHGSNAPFFLAL